MMLRTLILAALLASASVSLSAQAPAGAPGPAADDNAAAAAFDKDWDGESPVVTKHSIRAGGRTLSYTVTTGTMPIRSNTGDVEARMFFMAYTLDNGGEPGRRPLMFSFNGGPGSSSVWLHLGALGPRRVKMLDDGGLPPAPYELVDNEHTWLDQTDLVFIDPVGTGFSRATKPDLAKKFFGLQGDVQSVGEFIRLYLTKFERWSSPLFLVGESYGTTRASALSGYLVDRGIAFNGILLISTIMNFQTVGFHDGNDLPYAVHLPTYTAIAWYHKKLGPDLQQDLRKTLAEAEAWVTQEYQVALAKGDTLTAAERQATLEKLARYTGLSREYLDNTDLRVEISRFTKELLRSEKRTVGRLDGRFKGMDEYARSERPDFDPSMAAIRPPYTAALNDYVRRELGYKNESEYYILGGGIGPWDWGRDNQYADTAEPLRAAFAKNPWMKLFVAYGYYDLATPYFAAKYTLSHMNLDPSLRKNITEAYYEAGHMMYIDLRELAKLKKDVQAFVADALKKPTAQTTTAQ
jgi:carboxypeptidase C (cathepsin A)